MKGLTLVVTLVIGIALGLSAETLYKNYQNEFVPDMVVQRQPASDPEMAERIKKWKEMESMAGAPATKCSTCHASPHPGVDGVFDAPVGIKVYEELMDHPMPKQKK